MSARIALFCLALGGALPASAPAADCLRLTRAVAKGDALARDGLAPADCAEQPSRVLYDGQAHLVRAARDMAAGEIIAAVPLQRLALAVRGQSVRIRHRVGAVSVTREGTALVDAAPGRPVTAVTADGKLISGLPQQEAP